MITVDVSQADLDQLAREARLTPDGAREVLDRLSKVFSISTVDEVPRDRSMATAWSRWAAAHPTPR